MNRAEYYISADNEFVIENYNSAPTFSSFFPGIAGMFGCPMWVFYTNRGQCITSAGAHDKDRPVIEFQSANKAHRTVSLTGFRTFIKADNKFYEPFSQRSQLKNEMRISPHGLKISEENPELKLKIEVSFFTIPNEQFPGLARTVKLVNLANKNRQIEIIDGLPIIVPYGFVNDLLKRLSQTIEAWVTIENIDKKAPFYKLKVMPADVSRTNFIEKGNFYSAIASQDNKESQLDIIVDPATVFGEISSLELPAKFIREKNFKVPAKQTSQGITPSALAHKKAVLKKKGELGLFSVLGQIDSLGHLNKVRQSINRKAYFTRKASENQALIDELCAAMKTSSASKRFDLYAKQNFLDNVMRGGWPINVGNKVLYLYYRKHGDMERDYNDFKLMPTYFSQGNGNYRDINQNRRNDIFFNPEIAEYNIKRFINLIQLDGFNPLVVAGSRLCVESKTQAQALLNKHLVAVKENLVRTMITGRPFILGALLKRLEEHGVEYKTSKEAFARELIENASVKEVAEHGEGFWIDHFFYNTDLLESFAAIYPERLASLLFEQKNFTFYDNDHVVLERKEKYQLCGDKVRQYESINLDYAKNGLINSRTKDKNIVRTNHGQGKLYYATLITKLLCLTANKAASFDPSGIGLEMEADKPDWYDALNGLPALLGSSLSETLELKRLCHFILDNLPENASAKVPVEINGLIQSINKKINEFFSNHDNFQYWQLSYQIKEAYRSRIRLGLSGEEVEIDSKIISGFLNNIVKKCDYAVRQCLKKYDTYYTYFINEVTEFENVNCRIKVKKFEQKPLPLFLEGFVHALKVEQDKNIYKLVKNSPLYDKKLKMYKVNAPLSKTPMEIGRTRVFTPGWLENESVWLHMEYKYMLELLKAGQYDEFFSDFKNVFVPFMNVKKYRRSILENSSFIVSSAHPNTANHGRGFVARLSGATAEFIDIWLFMTSGKKLFSLDKQGKLTFKLTPILPGWLFNKGKFSFTLLGKIEVTYINKKNKSTYNGGVKPASYKLIFEDKEIEIDGPAVSEPYALAIRERKVKKIVVTLS